MTGSAWGIPALHSALDPAGTQAAHTATLWWLFFWVCAAVFLAVLAALGIALLRRRPGPPEAPRIPEQAAERRRSLAVLGAIGATVAILFGLLIVDFLVGRGIDSTGAPPDPNPLVIDLTGHQWWWEVRYDDPTPANTFKTANEIHIPVGRTVQLNLRSVDVIHSLWIPNLSGKRDLVPGHPVATWFHADREGTFRGPCAEFCGLQHANMTLLVVAQKPAEFQAWLDGQRKPAPEPADDLGRQGRDLFLGRTCLMCHAIGGTPAYGAVGPDLTHFGSRAMLGAAFANTQDRLVEWVADPSRLKPGVLMPSTPLTEAERRALAAYLTSLK